MTPADRDPVEAARTRAWAAAELGRYERALGEVAAVLAADPDDGDAHLLRVRALLGLGRTGEALRAAGDAVRSEPDFAPAHRALAAAHSADGNPRAAGRAAAAALRLDPRDPANHELAGELHLSAGRWADARSAALEALALDPGRPAALRLLAAAAVFGPRGGAAPGRPRPDADALVAAALRAAPGHPGTHALRGHLGLRTGRPSLASAGFREALRLDPTDARHRAGLRDALAARFPFVARLSARWSRLRDLPRGEAAGGSQWHLVLAVAACVCGVAGLVGGVALLSDLAPRFALPAVLVAGGVLLAGLFGVLLVWLLRGPLVDVLALADPAARPLLDARERRRAWLSAGCFAGAAGCVLAAAAVGAWGPVGVAAACPLYAAPLAAATRWGRLRRSLFAAGWTLAVLLGLAAPLAVTVADPDARGEPFAAVAAGLWGMKGYAWLCGATWVLGAGADGRRD